VGFGSIVVRGKRPCVCRGFARAPGCLQLDVFGAALATIARGVLLG
jgi:hypothetical protein